jgi:hypothetical protein
VLLALLGFDYDVFRKHIFHVYPLPAYAVAALWMGLGLAWLTERYTLRRAQALAAGVALLALIGAVGLRATLTGGHEWAARYAQTVLKMLPKGAVVFGQGDADLTPMAYFHMIEDWRPDITLYQSKGLILGNRLFHPLRINTTDADRVVVEMIERETAPVVFTLDTYTGYARRDHWLYIEVDKSSRDSEQITVDVPEEAMRFFEEHIATTRPSNDWIAFFQSMLRRRYAVLLAQSLPPGKPVDERRRRHLEMLSLDYYGALGIAEGMMLNRAGYSAGAVNAYLEKVAELMPSDAPKQYIARYFSLRGALRANMRDKEGAIRDLETAFSLWLVPDNEAVKPLEALYYETGDSAALQRLQDQVTRLKQRKR